MEALAALRTSIETGTYHAALLLLDEMEDMSRDDTINRLSSCMEVLLVHRITQAAEKKTTRSWEVAIRQALRQIVKSNTRRQAGGWSLTAQALRAAWEETYESAWESASLATLAGPSTADELHARVDRTAILALAWAHMHQAQMCWYPGAGQTAQRRVSSADLVGRRRGGSASTMPGAFPLYAALGVPEGWRSAGQQVSISHRTADTSPTVPSSTVLPEVTRVHLTQWVQTGREILCLAGIRRVRAWAASLIQASEIYSLAAILSVTTKFVGKLSSLFSMPDCYQPQNPLESEILNLQTPTGGTRSYGP